MGILDWITGKRTRANNVPPLATPPPGLVVVKVGGSLYDHRYLGPGLRQLIHQLDAAKVLIVSGGGEFANYVRELDAWHELGDEKAHELALLAAYTGMRFLFTLIGEEIACWVPLPGCDWWRGPFGNRPAVLLNCLMFLEQYENEHGSVPHTWELTTDSIAAYAAVVANAKLILLKSVDIPPGTPWEDAAKQGWVDAHFPSVVAKHNLTVEAINFRRWLDEREPRRRTRV